MTQEFEPGTKVHVEFDAIVEEPNEYDYIKADSNPYHSSSGLYANSDHSYGFLKVRDTENLLYHYVWVRPDYACNGALVTIGHKTDWEKYGGAQVGDIWEVNGHEYFTYASLWGLGVMLFPVDGVTAATYYTSDQHSEFAALNPRLVRRRGEEI